MERVIIFFREQAVCLDCLCNIRGLERYLYILKVQVLKDFDMVLGTLYESLRGWMSVFLKQCFIQRTCINTYPYRHGTFRCSKHYFFYLPGCANIAGVKPKTVYSLCQGFKSQSPVEMYISDNRDSYLLLNQTEGAGCIQIRNSQPDNLTSHRLQIPYLFNRGLHIAGISLCH